MTAGEPAGAGAPPAAGGVPRVARAPQVSAPHLPVRGPAALCEAEAVVLRTRRLRLQGQHQNVRHGFNGKPRGQSIPVSFWTLH